MAATQQERIFAYGINWYIKEGNLPITKNGKTITGSNFWQALDNDFNQFDEQGKDHQKEIVNALYRLYSSKEETDHVIADMIATGMKSPYYRDVDFDDFARRVSDVHVKGASYNALSLNRFNGLVDTMNTTWEDGHISRFTAIHGGDEKTPRNPYGKKRTEFKKETVKDGNGVDSQVWRANQFDESGLLIASIDYPYTETKNPADLRELESSGETSPIRKREYKYTDDDKDGLAEEMDVYENGQLTTRWTDRGKDGKYHIKYSDYNYDGDYFNRRERYDKDRTLREVYSDYNGQYFNRREDYDKDGTLKYAYSDVSQNGAYTKKEEYKDGKLKYTHTELDPTGQFYMRTTDAEGRITLYDENRNLVVQQPTQPEQQPTQPEQQPTQPTQPEQPEPERKQAIIHKYAEHDYQHAQQRIQEYIRRNPKSEDVIQAARANIEEMERTGQLPRGLDANGNICSNADIYLYKAIQAQELYHPDEPVYVVQDGKVTRKKDGTKTVSDKLGGSTRDLLGNLASENASECVDRVKSTEAAISARGHALLGVKTKGPKMSYRPGMKPGFEEMTVDIVEETDENGKITERVVPSSEVTEPVVPTNGTVQTPPLDGQSKDEANSPGNRGAIAALREVSRPVNTDETLHPGYDNGRVS